MTIYSSERIKLARERRGLTMKALAELTGLTSKTISNYENSAPNQEPTAQSMDKISRALGYPLDFFCNEDVPSLSPDAVSFRSSSKLSAKKRNAAISAGVLAKELHEWMANNFNLPHVEVPTFDSTDYVDPYEAAYSVRQVWGLGNKSISNMVHLLESKGVRVFSLAENCLEVDAFSFWEDNQPYVLLNTMKSPERSRFDAAHELGHLIMHKYSKNHGPEAEIEANQFASAFLMPEASIKSILRPQPSLNQLIKQKRNWNISLVALVRRSFDLGFSTRWHYNQLMIKLSQMGYRKVEPNGIDTREESQIINKIFSLLHDNGVTQDKVLSDLNWPLDELKNLTFGIGLGIHIAHNAAARPNNHWEKTTRKLRIVK